MLPCVRSVDHRICRGKRHSHRTDAVRHALRRHLRRADESGPLEPQARRQARSRPTPGRSCGPTRTTTASILSTRRRNHPAPGIPTSVGMPPHAHHIDRPPHRSQHRNIPGRTSPFPVPAGPALAGQFTSQRTIVAAHHDSHGYRAQALTTRRVNHGSHHAQSGTHPAYPISHASKSGTHPTFPISHTSKSGTQPAYPISRGSKSGTQPAFPIWRGPESGTQHAFPITCHEKPGTGPACRLKGFAHDPPNAAVESKPRKAMPCRTAGQIAFSRLRTRRKAVQDHGSVRKA